jgi:hypothetical protein
MGSDECCLVRHPPRPFRCVFAASGLDDRVQSDRLLLEDSGTSPATRAWGGRCSLHAAYGSRRYAAARAACQRPGVRPTDRLGHEGERLACSALRPLPPRRARPWRRGGLRLKGTVVDLELESSGRFTPSGPAKQIPAKLEVERQGSTRCSICRRGELHSESRARRGAGRCAPRVTATPPTPVLRTCTTDGVATARLECESAQRVGPPSSGRQCEQSSLKSSVGPSAWESCPIPRPTPTGS